MKAQALLYGVTADLPQRNMTFVMAWSFFASMMFGSSWGQIDDTLRGEIEPYNTAIIASKVAILAIALVALALSIRNATTSTKAARIN